MNKYAAYDKKDGSVKGTYSKYHWSKDEPVELTEKELLEEFKEELGAGDFGVAKIPEGLAKPALGTRLVFDFKQERLITINRKSKGKQTKK
jgi:hypothetical protein